MKDANKTALEYTICKTVGTFGPAYTTANRANIHWQTKDMMQIWVDWQAVVACS